MVKNYFNLLRVRQYLKNFFIISPAFFGEKIGDIDVIEKVAAVFFAFCFLASSIYIFNDIFDRKQDALHPQKKNRPIAAGHISILQASKALAACLVTAGLILTFFIPSVIPIALGYFILNLFYTLYLKHIAIIDVFTIASGFILRLISGGIASGVTLSDWIMVMTFLLALFLALAKRRDDFLLFLHSGKKIRKSIDGYNLKFLDHAVAMCGAMTIIAYIMYCISEEIRNRLGSENVFASAILVALGIFRYMQITMVEKTGESPTAILLRDKVIQGTLFCWLLFFSYLIYFRDIS